MLNKTIGFIGAGKMGTALIEGFLKNKLVEKKHIFICDSSKERVHYFNSLGIKSLKSTELAKKSEIIFLAVKPNQIKNICREINSCLSNKKIIISIAAGVMIKNIEEFLQKKVQIVRIMPNTPAIVNRGISVYCYNKQFNKNNLINIENLLKTVGRVLFLEEKHFDAVTGLSGSGPAYVFLMINSLAEGGVKMGLPKKVALELATQTVFGAAELVKKTGKHPEELKDMVTSPGGTTVEGLKVLENHKVRSAFIEAVEAGAKKSKKLMK